MTYNIHEAPAKDGEVRLELEVNGVHMATLTQIGRQEPQLTWLVYGPQSWPVAHQLMLGLLELSIHADRLSRGAFNVRTKG